MVPFPETVPYFCVSVQGFTPVLAWCGTAAYFLVAQCRRLYRDGRKMTLSGSSVNIVGGAYARDGVETQFGGFEGKHWQRCQLKIHFLGGGEGLSGANPKLRVDIELF